MNKKSFLLVTTFLLLNIVVTINLKAQIRSISYPSGYLSEEKIFQMLEESRKNGTQEWELKKLNDILHQQLKKQQDAIANGTYVNKTIAPPPQVMSGCNNVGFEDGTTNGWTMNVGNASGLLPCPTCITPGGSGGLYQVVNAASTTTVNTVGICSCNTIDCSPGPCTNGVDHFGGFPVVAPAPLGGSYSLLMNHSMCGLKMEQATQSFVVSASNTSFTYQFAAVLQDGGHPISAASYFEVSVTDLNTGQIVPCTQFTASAAGANQGNLIGWTSSTVDGTVYYKPWTTVTLDLSSIVNHTVSVEFTVSDCGGGAHFGYAYIDASCNSYSNQIVASNALCNGGSAVLYGPPGMASYNWAGPVTGSTPNLVTNVAGNYTLTTTTNTGCSSPVLYYTLTQGTGTPPNISVSASSNPVCVGSPVVLTANGATNYVWSTGETTSSITVTPTSNTTYTVNGSNGVGACGSAVTQIINVKPVPSVNLGNDTVICGTITQPIIYNAGASSGFTYHWSTGATTNTISVSSGGTYSVTVTSAAGCKASDSVKVLVVASNAFNVFDTSLCSANSLPIQLTAQNIPGNNNTYYWNNFPGGSTYSDYYPGPTTLNIYVNGGSCIITDIFNVVLDTTRPHIPDAAFCNSFTPYTVSAGNYAHYLWSTGATTSSIVISNPGTYWVKVTSTGGCTQADTFTVSVINPANVHVLKDTIICSPYYYYNYYANAYVQGAQSYLWNNGYNSPVQYIYNSGLYWVDIHFAGGCVVRDSFTIVFNQSPSVNLGSDQAICGPLSYPITLNGGYFNSYQWSTGANTQSISVNTSGIYWETVTSANGCKSTDSIDIQIYPYGNTYHDTDIVLCTSNLFPYQLNAGVPNNYNNYYTWSSGSSGYYATTNYIYNSGTYYVTVYINGYNSNCTVIDTFHVSTGTIIKPVIPNVIQCNTTTPDVLDAGTGYTNYYWSTGQNTQSITVNTSGIYVVTVTNNQGCKSKDTVTVAYNTSPVINILKDTAICNQSSVSINATYPGAISYLWSDGFNSPRHNISAGHYWVIYTMNTTCTANDSFNVTVKQVTYVDALPNIVTPNNDGKNDFIDFGVYQFPTMQLYIYDRWGTKIYESNDTRCIWSPTCDDGTYFYILTYNADCDNNNETKTLKGFFTILR